MAKGQIELHVTKRPKTTTIADLDPFFDRLANLSPTDTIGDWYIPSIGALERSDITMAGQAGRQFLYVSDRGSPYIGAMRMIVIKDTIYTLEMFYDAKSAASAYAIYDAMSKELKIGQGSSYSGKPATGTQLSIKTGTKTATSASSRIANSPSSKALKNARLRTPTKFARPDSSHKY
jgi:hypothetical protein